MSIYFIRLNFWPCFYNRTENSKYSSETEKKVFQFKISQFKSMVDNSTAERSLGVLESDSYHSI